MIAPEFAKKRIAALGLGAALAMAGSFEGMRNYAYLDPVGIPTICMGHTAGVKLGERKTDAECRDLLGVEFYEAAMKVQGCVPHPLSPNELGALADAVYNIGPAIACDPKKSTAARMLQAGDIEGACKQLPRWDKATVAGQLVRLPGLTRRREAEMKLCLGATS